MNETKEVLARIHDYSLEDIMGERFGRYSKYIIQDRAIPDVRDGLKPVQRRIIYAMYQDKNTYDKPFKKCANAVGLVLGRYHPHGDSSVYDALIHLSQKWKQNHILVQVDGNNGSIDGDPAAAMRYTETRLDKLSEELLKDIDKNTVEMALNYSDTLYEPTVLPAKFPNLLVNGTTGISAGYATNIPPHNLGEIIDATIKRIDSPNCHLDSILDIVKGPDFPTGGVIEGKEAIRQALTTGRGKVIVKAKYEFVKEKGKEQIIIHEIPFDTNKQQLVKKIDDIRISGKVSGMAEVRDESDKDAFVRIVIDLKPNANKDLIMAYLFKNTDLQSNFSYNMVSIVNRRPKIMGVIGMIDAYIEFDKEIVRRRCEFNLAALKKEIIIVEGLVKAMSILDDVIKTIRASKNKADAEANLVKKFDFLPEQAEAIVKLQLYRLTNTDIVELQNKLKELQDLIRQLEEILANPEKLNGVIKNELRAIKKEYAVDRRTEVKDEVEEMSFNAEDLIVKENVFVMVTHDGYVKKLSTKSFANNTLDEVGLKEGDYVLRTYEATTLMKLLIITKLGSYLYLPVNEIPVTRLKDLGKHVSNFVPIDPNDEVVSAYIVDEKDASQVITFFTKEGMVKRTELSSFIVSRYNKTYTAMKLKAGDEITNTQIDKDNTLLVTKTGYYISYKTSEIPVSSAKSQGVKGINLKDDFVISGLTYNDEDEYLNIFTDKKTGKRVKLAELTQLSRAKRGSMVIKKVKSTNYNIVSALITRTPDFIGLSSFENVERIKNTDIPIMDLASTGSAITKKSFEKAFTFSIPVTIKETTGEVKKKEAKPKKVDVQEEMEFIEDFKI